MMISVGENLGWAQKMIGHPSLKMSYDNKFDCNNRKDYKITHELTGKS